MDPQTLVAHMTLWQWLNTNAGVLTILLTLVLTLGPLIAGAFSHMALRRSELKVRRQEMFDAVIGHLIEPLPGATVTMLDRQIAAVFELRNFAEYYEVSARILVGLLNQWQGADPRIRSEMRLGVEYMNHRLRKVRRVPLPAAP